MGGAQPLALTMNDGVALVVEVDAERIARRIDNGYLDEAANGLDDAISRVQAARSEGRPLSIGVEGNAADVFSRAAATRGRHRHRHRPDVGARPAQRVCAHTATPWTRPLSFGGPDPETYIKAARQSMAVSLRGDGRVPGRGGRGVRLREQPARRSRAWRVRQRIRLSRVRACLFAGFVQRRHGAVPMGSTLRRPLPIFRSRTTRCDGCFPDHRALASLAGFGRGAGPVSGPPCPDSCGSAMARGIAPVLPSTNLSASGEVQAPIVHREGSHRFRDRWPLRTGKPRRCATARTRSQTGRSSTPCSIRHPGPPG